jgi:hypothetical protein
MNCWAIRRSWSYTRDTSSSTDSPPQEDWVAGVEGGLSRGRSATDASGAASSGVFFMTFPPFPDGGSTSERDGNYLYLGHLSNVHSRLLIANSGNPVRLG